jgi:hypothetical protein
MVDDNERVVEEAGVSNNEVQRVVDKDEKGAAVMSGEPNVDCGAAVSEVDTELVVMLRDMLNGVVGAREASLF